MRVCGVELKGNDALICILSKHNEVIDIPDCRQIRFTLPTINDAEMMRKFQFTFKKLMEDYKIDKVAVRKREPKGKFAGTATSFKFEAAIQLIEELDVEMFSGTDVKQQIKMNKLMIDFRDTGLKAFQEEAFTTAYAGLFKRDEIEEDDA